MRRRKKTNNFLLQFDKWRLPWYSPPHFHIFIAKNGRTQGKNVILFTPHCITEIQAWGLEKDVFVDRVTCVGQGQRAGLPSAMEPRLGLSHPHTGCPLTSPVWQLDLNISCWESPLAILIVGTFPVVQLYPFN